MVDNVYIAYWIDWLVPFTLIHHVLFYRMLHYGKMTELLFCRAFHYFIAGCELIISNNAINSNLKLIIRHLIFIQFTNSQLRQKQIYCLTALHYFSYGCTAKGNQVELPPETIPRSFLLCLYHGSLLFPPSVRHLISKRLKCRLFYERRGHDKKLLVTSPSIHAHEISNNKVE